MCCQQFSKLCCQVAFLFVTNQDEGSVQSTCTNKESGLMAYENRALPEKQAKKEKYQGCLGKEFMFRVQKEKNPCAIQLTDYFYCVV